MIGWIKDLFKDKLKSNINKVTIAYGNLGADYHQAMLSHLENFAVPQQLSTLQRSSVVSMDTKVKALKPDCLLIFTFASVLDELDCEVTYFKSDDKSERMAVHFAKAFKKYFNKDVVVKSIDYTDRGFGVIAPVMFSRYGICIKLFNHNTDYIEPDQVAKFISTWLQDI